MGTPGSSNFLSIGRVCTSQTFHSERAQTILSSLDRSFRFHSWCPLRQTPTHCLIFTKLRLMINDSMAHASIGYSTRSPSIPFLHYLCISLHFRIQRSRTPKANSNATSPLLQSPQKKEKQALQGRGDEWPRRNTTSMTCGLSSGQRTSPLSLPGRASTTTLSSLSSATIPLASPQAPAQAPLPGP